MQIVIFQFKLHQCIIGGISGQLKYAFDRLFAVAECNEGYANPKKDVILFMATEGDDEDNFASVRAYYEGLVKHFGWNDLGIVYAGGNFDAGTILSKSKKLEEAYNLGKSIK